MYIFDEYFCSLGQVVQWVTCLIACMCVTADQGVESSIQTQSHTVTKIDHENISMDILLHSADLRWVVVSYKQTCVDKVLVNRLDKLAQEKVWLDEHDHSCWL